MYTNTMNIDNDGRGNITSTCWNCGYMAHTFVNRCPTCAQVEAQQRIAEATDAMARNGGGGNSGGRMFAENDPIILAVTWAIVLWVGWWLLGLFWDWAMTLHWLWRWGIAAVILLMILAPIIDYYERHR